ncbi:LamG-like jellyroll fold domain-containing protein [Phytohabitans aurantiacus]|uniref:LamG-like jellyroll fold domain-containing protein n=1 Tax=Phytohabitans aurantiacus TaxID=3016789 RepID=UPI0024934858|nr:LamG-like jellyroll fold domain-containing protein [Phytohabitans aurantiacus]
MFGAKRWLRGVGLAAGLAALMAVYTHGPGREEPATPVALDTGVRQTEVDAAALAAASGTPVEIGAFRNEYREVYANPDGSRTAVEHVRPVRMLRGGRWVGVDATLVRRPDGSIGPRAATVGLLLSGGGQGPFAAMERSGRRLALSWPGTLPAPVLDGATATYRNVLPDVDLVVTADVDGFSHVLVVKTADAARHPTLSKLELPVRADGLAIRQTATGGVEAVDASGGAVFEAPTPLMWDAGAAVRRPLGVQVGARSLTLVPDQRLLTDPATRFPIVIDPVWKSSSRSGWAMVASGYPGEKYWKFDGASHEGMGECPVASGTCAGVGVKRLFYAIPTSAYKGKTILSATFRVTLYHTYDDTARPARLHLTGAISSATTWNNQPSWKTLQDEASPSKPTGSCTSTNQNAEFTATDAVTTAASKGWATTTFGLRADDEGSHLQWKRFCNNALLEVNYNTAPSTPKQSELTLSPGGACVYGSAAPYTDVPPKLNAVLRDPDHSSAHAESLKAEFKVYWTNPSTGALEERHYTTSAKPSGSTFYYTVPASIPENVVLAWEVRASDGTAWSAWSSAGDQTRCQFVYDKTRPAAPAVTSADFPDDDQGHDGVGRYGGFRFQSNSADVSEYWYGVNQNPSANNKVTTTVGGGPVEIRIMATKAGPNWLSVVAVDRAGKTSSTGVHLFIVNQEPATGEWRMEDDPGSGQAVEVRGGTGAVAAGGVTFGVPGPGGAADRAVRLDGTAGTALTAGSGLLDTSRSFAVSAWARAAATDGSAVAVSVDGSGEPGFTLGYHHNAWALRVPVTDVDTLSEWRVSGGSPVAGEWAHLTGVFDHEKGVLTLYVNGTVAGSGTRRSAWVARGAVQIGRSTTKAGPENLWRGDLADVRVFDRIATPQEIGDLVKLAPKRRGYWPLNDAANGASPEATGGQDLALSGGPAIYLPQDPILDPPALVGDGHLLLDGVDDHAATAGPVTATKDSFTVTARVRLAAAAPGRAMAVLSAPGVNTSAFVVRYSPGSDAWELVLPHADQRGDVATTSLIDDQRVPSADPSGQHLAVVYDGFADEIRLYVDGQLADSAVAPHPGYWNATGGLQVGRALVDGAWGEHFAGAIDDVRVYSGAADATVVQLLAQPVIEQPDL